MNLDYCYVNLWQAPLGVWKAYQRGVYPVAEDIAAVGAGRKVRLGSYGDPRTPEDDREFDALDEDEKRSRLRAAYEAGDLSVDDLIDLIIELER